jgi:hypothetical protein
MPVIGEIRNARELSKKYHNRMIWHACVDCGEERWVIFRNGRPDSQRCHRCGGIYGGRFHNE